MWWTTGSTLHNNIEIRSHYCYKILFPVYVTYPFTSNLQYISSMLFWFPSSNLTTLILHFTSNFPHSAREPGSSVCTVTRLEHTASIVRVDLSWLCSQYVPLKQQYVSTRPHGVTSQDTIIVSAIKISTFTTIIYVSAVECKIMWEFTCVCVCVCVWERERGGERERERDCSVLPQGNQQLSGLELKWIFDDNFILNLSQAVARILKIHWNEPCNMCTWWW
jgi:hypothetical protein